MQWFVALNWFLVAMALAADPVPQNLEERISHRVYPGRYLGYYKDIKAGLHGCEVSVQNGKLSGSKDGWQLAAISVRGGDGFSVRGNTVNLVGLDNEELKDHLVNEKQVRLSVNHKTIHASGAGFDQGTVVWLLELGKQPYQYEAGKYQALKSVSAHTISTDKAEETLFVCSDLEIVSGN